MENILSTILQEKSSWSTIYRLKLPNFLSTILDLFINNQQLIFGPHLQSTEKVHPPPTVARHVPLLGSEARYMKEAFKMFGIMLKITGLHT